MKFSTPGHSCVQEIDSVHSCIERILKKSEYFSPLSLLRFLLKVSSVRPYNVIQMSTEDFKDFKSCVSAYNYNLVPFSKVKALKFTQIFTQVEYKTSHQITNWQETSIRLYKSTRSGAINEIKTPKVSTETKNLSTEKIKAIRSMYPWMPQVDKAYFETILPKQ